MSEDAQELKREKRALRREVLARRDAVPIPERERAATSISRRALGVIDAVSPGRADTDTGGHRTRPDSRTVMAFWSFGSEVATGALIEALAERGDAVALPRIVDGELEARTFAPGDALDGTSFGAMEPAGGTVLTPEELDVVLVPGVAFDRRGRRVGYGGGYYDRFLAGTRADVALIAVCFEVQLVDEVPAAAFDLPVDVIVTERRTIRGLRER